MECLLCAKHVPGIELCEQEKKKSLVSGPDTIARGDRQIQTNK